MDKKKLRQCAEGLIVTAAGLGYVLLSLGIRRNPVKTDGFWGLLTEAKFLPLLLSAMLTLQGVRLTAALWKGQEVSAGGHSITKRSVSVVLLTLAYLLLISKVGFTLPTAAYFNGHPVSIEPRQASTGAAIAQRSVLSGGSLVDPRRAGIAAFVKWENAHVF